MKERFVFQILGTEPTTDIADLMIRTGNAKQGIPLAMAPLQDFLGLGSKARMNTPVSVRQLALAIRGGHAAETFRRSEMV